MVKLYYTLIINKQKTFAQCPVSLQPQIHDMLLANKYDDNGNLIVTP